MNASGLDANLRVELQNMMREFNPSIQGGETKMESFAPAAPSTVAPVAPVTPVTPVSPAAPSTVEPVAAPAAPDESLFSPHLILVLAVMTLFFSVYQIMN